MEKLKNIGELAIYGIFILVIISIFVKWEGKLSPNDITVLQERVLVLENEVKLLKER